MLKRTEHPSEGFNESPKKRKLKTLITVPLFNPSANPEIITLNITDFIGWDAQQVASVLTATTNSVCGCNLPNESILQLINAHFNGSSLNNIVNDILLAKQGGQFDITGMAFQHLNNIYNIDGTPQLANSLKTIVHWVNNNLIDTHQPIDPSSPIETDELTTFFKNFITRFKTNLTNENIEKSASVVIHGFGSDFKFVGRDAVLVNYESYYEEYLDALFNNGQVIRDKIAFPFIASAPGIGKSRIMKEIGCLMFRKKKFFPLFTSFGNGTSFASTESPINGLCIRIFYSIFCAFTGKEGQVGFFTMMKSLWKKIFHNRQVLDLETILLVCKELISPNEEINFFLGMDEVQEIESPLINSKSTFDFLVKLIGGYMQQPTCGIVYPLFTGTYYTKQSLIGSGWAALYIPIETMLPISTLGQIIDAFVIKYGKLQDWRMDGLFRHYLRKIGGFARGLEFYLEHLLKTKPEQAWEDAKTRILRKYTVSSSLSSNIKKTIVECIITRKVVAKTDMVDKLETWSDLENRGLVMLEPIINSNASYHFTVTYPQFIFSDLIHSDFKATYDFLFESDTCSLCGASWEDVLHNYYFLILQLLQNRQHLKFKELFPFALMNSSISKMEIDKINKCYQCKSNQQIDGDLSHRSFLIFNKDSRDIRYNPSKNTFFIVKNACSASAGDLLIFGAKNSDESCNYVFHLQCKWAADGNVRQLEFSTIQSELNKNRKLELPGTNEEISTRNITVIITGKSIKELPKEIPDDLIIIYKDNFAKHFGLLSEHMKYIYATNFLYINQVTTTDGFKVFGVDRNDAKKILKIRNENHGFKDWNHLQQKTQDLFPLLDGLDIIF